MSEISLFPTLVRPVRPPTFFKLEAASPSKMGFYYKRLMRFIDGSTEQRMKTEITILVHKDGRDLWYKAPPLRTVSLNAEGLLCLECHPMLVGELDLTVVMADIRDDEGYDLLPICWGSIDQRLFQYDTLNLTYGIKSESFLEPTCVWEDPIIVQFNNNTISVGKDR